ncbi:hypothetical protein ACVW0I_006983 [Bradyrhizobium sp. LM6.11]
MISEAPTISIADQAGHQGADSKARKGDRNIVGIHLHIGPTLLDEGTQHASGHLVVEAVEEHSEADKAEDSPLKCTHREPVEPAGGINGGGHQRRFSRKLRH